MLRSRMPTSAGDVAADELDDVTTSSVAVRVARPQGQKKILVVDDEPDAVESMAAILREDGYTVETASTAEDALEKFRSETYHLLITDLFLPGKSGVDLTKMVHEG